MISLFAFLDEFDFENGEWTIDHGQVIQLQPFPAFIACFSNSVLAFSIHSAFYILHSRIGRRSNPDQDIVELLLGLLHPAHRVTGGGTWKVGKRVLCVKF